MKLEESLHETEIWYYLTELDKKQGQAIYLHLDDNIRKT